MRLNKVFISHKKEDSAIALSVERTLENCGVDSYLDIRDNEMSRNGRDLTEHIKNQLAGCTDIIVILSDATKKSWWVPFEIGLATEKDMPIANYCVSNIQLPEYLESWPILNNGYDVHKYVEIRHKVSDIYRNRINKSLNESYMAFTSRLTETQEFYRQFKMNID